MTIGETVLENGTSIVNPAHPIPDEVAEGLRYAREQELAALARQDEIAKLGRPSEEERRSITELYEQAAQALGLDVEELRTRLRDIGTNKLARIEEAARRDARQGYELVPLDLEPPPPDRMDHDFWYASFQPFFPPDAFQAIARPDGLHVTGLLVHHSGDLRTTRFGMVTTFELQAERIPHSPSGLWRSSPHVELFGGISGNTGDDDFTTGDLWAKCWMHRRQTIWQFTLGGSIVVAEAWDPAQTLIFEENEDRTVRFQMPGFQGMPQVRFGNINMSQSLFAQLEVRFDIQVEGDGSSIGTTPEVLLRTGFQWPLVPA